MVQGISAALSALQVLGRKIGITANNIANANTQGFKKSRAISQDLPSARIGTIQIGRGTVLGEISESLSQGAFIPTESVTDFAIGGEGFFIVKAPGGGNYYTRNGHFGFDNEGRLVDSLGNILQGWAVDPESGGTEGSIGDISLSTTVRSGSDGYGPGDLQSVTVNPDGVVTGNYSNGNIRDLFQIAIARFPNAKGLNKVGNNLYSATRESGEALTGTAGSNGLGRIVPQSLEESNVDLAEELTNMIIFQRSYQANLKVLEMENELKGDVLNIIS